MVEAEELDGKRLDEKQTGDEEIRKGKQVMG